MKALRQFLKIFSEKLRKNIHKLEKNKLTIVNIRTNGQNTQQTIVQNMLTGTVEQLLTPENLYLIYGNKFGIFTHPEYKCPQIYII